MATGATATGAQAVGGEVQLEVPQPQPQQPGRRGDRVVADGGTVWRTARTRAATVAILGVC